jgi:hypothetical protein
MLCLSSLWIPPLRVEASRRRPRLLLRSRLQARRRCSRCKFRLAHRRPGCRRCMAPLLFRSRCILTGCPASLARLLNRLLRMVYRCRANPRFRSRGTYLPCKGRRYRRHRLPARRFSQARSPDTASPGRWLNHRHSMGYLHLLRMGSHPPFTPHLLHSMGSHPLSMLRARLRRRLHLPFQVVRRFQGRPPRAGQVRWRSELRERACTC